MIAPGTPKANMWVQKLHPCTSRMGEIQEKVGPGLGKLPFLVFTVMVSEAIKLGWTGTLLKNIAAAQISKLVECF